MADARNIPVKVYLDADAFVAFSNRCKDFGMSHSSLLRSLAMQWTNDRAAGLAGHSTSMVLVQAQPAACDRVNFGSAPVHLRL